MTSILIAEDEPRIAGFVEKGLRAHGFATAVSADGNAALEAALSGAFDLMVLDLGLPGRDGREVLAELRRCASTLPVIVLTAHADVHERVAVLEGGAADFMAKPFSFEELLARVRLRLRRPVVEDPNVLQHAGITLDLRTHRATVDDEVVELTAQEMRLAETFLRHPGQVLSREQLLSRVWGYDHDPESNVVDVYVGYLRRKLGAEHIQTVRGVGYRWEGRATERP